MKKVLFIMVSIVIIFSGYYLYTTEFWEPKSSHTGGEVASVAELQEKVEAVKEELKEKGEYRCCIQNDCAWCAIYMGHCVCGDLVEVEGREQSCPECAAAWDRKRGKIPGVDPDAVEVITFGVYGFENEGKHYHPPLKGEEEGGLENHHHGEEVHHNTEGMMPEEGENHHHDNDTHHSSEETDLEKKPLSHDEIHKSGTEHSH